MKVTPYVAPVTQCYACYRYGHTKAQCKSKTEICRRCGKTHDKSDTECSMRCVNCGGEDHEPTSRQCSERIRQQVIKQLMAYENLTYFDANEKIPKKNENEYLYDQRNFPALPNRSQENRNNGNHRSTTNSELSH